MSRPEHIPLELLETFVKIAEMEGDATAAAERLDISQPSISKRLAALRRATSDPDGVPWLLLKGKRWRVTDEGHRVLGVVSDLVHRYEQLERFIASDKQSNPIVSIACGQQAANGSVKLGIERFLKESPKCRVRLSTPRGRSRIEGVAGGQFDLAIVSDSPSAIRQIARVELYVEALLEDHFILVANPSARSIWAEQWHNLSTERSVTAREVFGLPFILPEPDAARRRQFDEWSYRAAGQPFDVILETGGWQTILEFAASGVGVGLVTKSAFDSFQSRQANKLNSRLLSTKEFPPDAVRLIARKAHGKDEPELSESARKLFDALHATIK